MTNQGVQRIAALPVILDPTPVEGCIGDNWAALTLLLLKGGVLHTSRRLVSKG